jgi:hypothetical protein
MESFEITPAAHNATKGTKTPPKEQPTKERFKIELRNKTSSSKQCTQFKNYKKL